MIIESVKNTSKERKEKVLNEKVLNLAHFKHTFNILTAGAKLPKLNFYRVVDFLYQVSPESFKIGSSKQELSLAGWTKR